MIAVGLGGLVLFLLLLLLKKRTAAKETLKTFASFELLLGAEISTPLHPLSPSRPPAHGRMRLWCVRPRTRAIWSAAARTESRAARCV